MQNKLENTNLKAFTSLSIPPVSLSSQKTYEQTKTANFIHDRFYFPWLKEFSLPSKT